MRYQGKITDWKDDQGYGFISPNGGGKQVFVHIKSLSNRKRRPALNEIVTYELTTDKKYRFQAKKVAFIDERTKSSTSIENSRLILIFTLAFLLVLAVLFSLGKLPAYVMGFYLTASFITFLIYAIDKSAARKNYQRIPENTLHFLALIGGWPGAFVGQRMLHHKSKKQSFQVIYIITVFINCGILGWALTPSGAKLLQVVST